MKVIAYTRVSTRQQVQSGLALETQQATITGEAERRGWEIVAWASDEGISGAKASRPGLDQALERIEAGEAGGLIAAKLDRVARSVLNFADLLERADANGWSLVMCDQAVDTSTIQGRFVVQIMSAVAELERSLISERTRSALASKRKRGGECGGFANVSRPLAQRIVAARDDGVSFAEIARSFTAEGIPTATGGAEWNPSTVRTVYKRYTRDIDLGIVEEVVAKGATFP